jgi:hypothetical protein
MRIRLIGSTLLISFWIIILSSCEKMEVLEYDPNIHTATAVNEYGDTLIMTASFLKEPEDVTGMYRLNFRSYDSNNSGYTGHALSLTVRLNELSIDCTSLEFVNRLDELNASYPNGIVRQRQDDQNLGFIYLQEDKESTLCISRFLSDGNEIEGSFDLYLKKVNPTLPSLATIWPDSMNLKGHFKAFGRNQN